MVKFLRHPMRVGSTLYGAGTEVELLSASDLLVQAAFPNIKPNEESSLVAIRMLDRDHATIVHRMQLI